MEDVAKDRKCGCGRMVNRLFKFCPECGEMAVMLRSENEIKAIKKQVDDMVDTLTGVSGDKKEGVGFLHPVMMPILATLLQTRSTLLWIMGDNKVDPVGGARKAVSEFLRNNPTRPDQQ